MQAMPLVSGSRRSKGVDEWMSGRVSQRSVPGCLPAEMVRIWSLAIVLLLGLSGCFFAPKPPTPVEIDLYQQWQLQPGDTIAGRTVTGGLGDISIALDGKPIYAPFDGRVQPTTANCILFSSADLPGYLFRLCGLSAPKLGTVSQGEAIGSGKHLEFAALRKQADGRWAIVEPSKRILERSLQQP
jgi:hypothetical protein